MSVYTQLTEPDFAGFLALYDVGELVSWQGVEAGVENTNYFVNTRHSEDLNKDKRQFVFTIFEYLAKEQLPFIVQFMELLAEAGLPVPAPVRGRDGLPLRVIKGKPCMLQPRLPGNHMDPAAVSLVHCRMVGECLARIHTAGQDAECRQSNVRGMAWIGQQIHRLAPLLPDVEARLQIDQWQAITAELNGQATIPRGLIHADLFVDNVLFEDGEISGIIDLFQSCEDWLLYDVAVTVNDWCLSPGTLSLSPEHTNALLTAYHAIRPFTDGERRLWPWMHRLVCLRFWISRIVTYTHPEQQPNSSDSGDEKILRRFKDPAKFRDMLVLRTVEAAELRLPRAGVGAVVGK